MRRNKQGPLEADTAFSVHPVSRIGPYWAFISSTNFDKLYVFYHLKKFPAVSLFAVWNY